MGTVEWVDEINKYFEKNASKITVKKRYDDDLAELDNLLNDLRKKGKIID